MDYSTQLKLIMKASGESQELVARHLGVSFATVNSWVNKRSQPRKKMLLNIEKLYVEVIGADEVNSKQLEKAVSSIRGLHVTAKKIVNSRQTLDKLLLLLTYHSNTIEGSTMTLADTEKVIFLNETLTNRTAIEQIEARNHQATLRWLLQKIIDKNDKLLIDEPFILEIHLRLMNGIIGDAGEYRKHSVRITGSGVPLANWQKIPSLITKLNPSFARTTPEDVVGNFARTHASFEQIHPFSDGNGRTGRLILLVQALQLGLIPPVMQKERKHAYYKYLAMAQTTDDYRPLELFIAQSMQFANKEIFN